MTDGSGNGGSKGANGGNGHHGGHPDLTAVRGDDDVIQPFVLERSGVRGRLVRAGPMVDAILTRHAYPAPVAQLLGEALALAGLMSGMLKYEGMFTLQMVGDGPVKMLVADFTSDGSVRGYADFDADRVAQLGLDARQPNAEVVKLLGQGRLAYTVDHKGAKDRYQGIVELNGATLAECMHHYFQQSEQVVSSIQLTCGRLSEGDGTVRWRAGGLMLQRLPEEAGERTGEDPDEDWRRAVILMSSVTQAEMVRPDLSAHDLLYRLFHEEGVRVFETWPLKDQCRCSRERVETVLMQMDREELSELKTDAGVVEVTCQYCSTVYTFDDDQIAALHDQANGGGDGSGPG
jgi:molecular chaperone Hsp33